MTFDRINLGFRKNPVCTYIVYFVKFAHVYICLLTSNSVLQYDANVGN